MQSAQTLRTVPREYLKAPGGIKSQCVDGDCSDRVADNIDHGLFLLGIPRLVLFYG